jgi:hypothetical protein
MDGKEIEVNISVGYIWSNEGDSHVEKDYTICLPLRLP